MEKQRRSAFILFSVAALMWLSALLLGPRPTAAQVTIQLTPTLPPTSVHYLPMVAKDYPLPTATLPPNVTPTPTITLSPFNFTKTNDSPAYLPNFANANGCAWHGISGQVFDLDRRGVLGLIVRVTGPNSFQNDTLTGSVPKYGPSGYEITLGAAPIDSNDFRIQLWNGAGQALSDSIVVPTFAQCNKNHIIFNFAQNH
ncbi:MAG: hypothetical protein ACT4QE_09415 [Anaerolineales bacterium]